MVLHRRWVASSVYEFHLHANDPVANQQYSTKWIATIEESIRRRKDGAKRVPDPRFTSGTKMMEETSQAGQSGGAREGNPRSGPTPTYNPVWLALIGLSLLLFLVAGAWSGYWADLRNDQYQLIHLGQLVEDGGRMYIDGWENKPPGIAWINALGITLSGGTPLGAWILPAVVAGLAIAVLGATMKRVLSPVSAGVTMVLAGIVFTIRLYDATSINPDFYSAVFDLVACSLWITAVNASKPGRMFGLGYMAGVAWAVALIMKQTGIIGPVVLTVITLMLSVLRIPGHKRWLLTCVAGWIGMGGLVAGVIWVLHGRGNGSEAWAAIYTFNRDLVGLESIKGILHSWSRVYAGLGPVQLALWLGFVGLIATWRVGKDHKPTPASVTALGLWWSGQVVAALLGPSGSMRYWMATFPPMIWLAGIGIHHIQLAYGALAKANRTAFAIVCLTAVFLLGHPLFDHYRAGLASSNVACSQETSPRRALEQLGQQIQSITPEGKRIYVWDYDSGLYVHSDRRAASRFTYPRSHEQLRQILADLSQGKAHTLLIPTNGSTWFDPLCDEMCKSSIADLLTSYEERDPIGRYAAWTRKD